MMFMCYLVNSISIPEFTASSQVNSTSNLTEEMPLQESLTPNQSSDIKDIKRSTSEEVRVSSRVWAENLAKQPHRVNMRL